MRQITKDIEITIDGSPVGFRLFKLDAFFRGSVALPPDVLRVNDSTPPWKSHKIRLPGKLCGILVLRFFGLLKSEIV